MRGGWGFIIKLFLCLPNVKVKIQSPAFIKKRYSCYQPPLCRIQLDLPGSQPVRRQPRSMIFGGAAVKIIKQPKAYIFIYNTFCLQVKTVIDYNFNFFILFTYFLLVINLLCLPTSTIFHQLSPAKSISRQMQKEQN